MNKELTTKSKPRARFLNAKAIYAELNLICLKLFKKTLGFNYNHIPEKSWLKNCLFNIAKSSILDLNFDENESLVEWRYQERIQNLQNYTNWKEFEYYRNKIYGGIYFRFGPIFTKRENIIYDDMIEAYDTENSESENSSGEKNIKKKEDKKNSLDIESYEHSTKSDNEDPSKLEKSFVEKKYKCKKCYYEKMERKENLFLGDKEKTSEILVKKRNYFSFNSTSITEIKDFLLEGEKKNSDDSDWRSQNSFFELNDFLKDKKYQSFEYI